MSLELKIGQMLVAGFEGLEAPDYFLQWLSEGRLGGVILFARNVESPVQLARLTQQLHGAAKTPILIAIDQEGGTVARLRDGFSESPGAMALSAAQDGPALCEAASRILAEEMRAVGINWDYAPVVDITHNIDNPSVGTRSFGTDKARVSEMAAAAVRGFQAGGVAACAKHFPGLGNTPVDTHIDLAVITDSPEYLYEHDLVPFRAAVEAGVSSVMMTHVRFDALDNQFPATMSPIVIQRLLREEMGFRGLVTTDCMEMNAITHHFGTGEAAVQSILAGTDILLHSHTRPAQEAAYNALLEAARSGRLSEARIDEANERIAAFKARYAITAAPDLTALRRPQSLAQMEKAARAGCVLLRDDPGCLPVKAGQNVALVEFASTLESGIMESGGVTGLAAALQQQAPDLKSLALASSKITAERMSAAKTLAAEADVLILATRSAHIIDAQKAACLELMSAARKTILLCLRNPYDVAVLPGAAAILCTCGDSAPSLSAAVDALLGRFIPDGILPVEAAPV